MATTSVLLVDDRVAVAELAGELDLDGDPAPVLDRVLGDLPGVGGGAAGDDHDLVDRAQHRLVDAQLVEHQLAVGVRAAQQGVGDGLRLLVDLLVHEDGKPPFSAAEASQSTWYRWSAAGAPSKPVTSTASGVMVTIWSWPELERLAGVRDEGRDVGAEEVLAVAEADHQRGVAAGADDHVGVVGVHGEQRERALEAAADRAHGVGQVAEVGVGLPTRCAATSVSVSERELDALGQQLGLERREVLDDAVVDQRERARRRSGAGARWRRWGRRGWPSGCARSPVTPAGSGCSVELLVEVGQLAGVLGDAQPPSGLDERDARGVVAAVLQPAQTLQDDVQRIGAVNWADVPDDSTHGRA